MSPMYRLMLALFVALVVFPSALRCSAQQIVYDDALENGWQNYGWATLNYSNASPVHSGADSISVTSTGAYQALYLHHAAFDSTPFASLSFWINPGTGGQRLQVQATLNGSSQAAVLLPALTPNTWQQVVIPLTSLGVSQQPTMDGFWIQDTTGTTPAEFYIDDVQFTAAAVPSLVNIAINGGSVVQHLDTRLLGLNAVMWDSSVGSSATQSLIGAAGFKILRWPGGSSSDSFDWSTNKSDGNTWSWGGTTGALANLAISANATAIITVNYGSGTPQMAAAWVAYFNGSPTSTQVIGVDSRGRNWGTVGSWAALRAASPLAADDGYNFLRIAHAASLHFQQYEIGNECYGSWENDQHGVSGSGLSGLQHDPYTYAQSVAQFIPAMKAVDSTIKIGCVAIPGEDDYGGGAHSVTNPNENNSVHTGWTPVMLSTLHGFGYVPDFIIDHRYPEAPGSESDSGLLASTAGWPGDAKDLRKQITDYVGTAGSTIELDATETNCVYSNPGKQSTSLVNALYAADSLGMLSQTEFKDLNWWDMRNAYDPSENNSSSLFGWRNYGDYGLISSPGAPDPANTPYPPYYAFKLAGHWVTTGSSAVATTSSYPMLTAYAAEQADGSLAVLVVNKSAASNLNGSIGVSGIATGASASVYSYGKGNDSANGDLTSSSLPTVTMPLAYTFPAYSMTVIRIAAPVSGPTVATAASPSPATVTGTTAVLSVLGADPGGEAALTYTWATTGTPPAAVKLSANGNNAAKSVTVTFAKAGTYNFTATILNSAGRSVSSSTSVTVKQTPVKVIVSPATVTLPAGATQAFTAAETDQFGAAITPQALWAWSTTRGSVTSAGLYTAPPTAGTDSVRASDTTGGVAGTAAVTVNTAQAKTFAIYGTGGSGTLAAGTADPHFTLVKTVAGTALVGVLTGNALVTASNGGFPTPLDWIADVPNVASWISPRETYIEKPGTQDAAGIYIYEQKFDLTGFLPATANVTGVWAVDSTVVGVYLIGVKVNGSGGYFNVLTSFTLNSHFVTGVNTLDIVVNNYPSGGTNPNPTGLFLEIKSAAATPG